MKSFVKRLAGGKKGLEALQAVLILVVAFFLILALKDYGRQAVRKADDQGGGIVNPDKPTPPPPPAPKC